MRELERTTYRASTGREYEIIRYEDPDAQEPWPRKFWLYEWRENGQWWSHGAAYLADRHLTLDAAKERIEAHERIRAATDSLPERVTRDEYENACQRAGVEPWSDDEIAKKGYAITYGEFTLPAYSVGEIIAMSIAKPRLAAIDAERDAERAARLAKVAPAPPAPSDVVAPAGTTPTLKSYGTGPCGRCHEPDSYWNAGAGEYLCSRHWDDY